MKTFAILAAVLFTVGCTMRAEFSMMKQWDRPAERTITEDTSHNVKQPPRTTIETQEQINVAPATPRPSAVDETYRPSHKPMKSNTSDHEVVPAVIVPDKPSTYIYQHIHHKGDSVCYVRKTLGVYAAR